MSAIRTMHGKVLLNIVDHIPASRRLWTALKDVRAPIDLCDRAAQGEFDDLQSFHAFPKLALLHELRQLKMEDFAARVIAGEFDTSRADAQHWINFKQQRAEQWRQIRGVHA